jgi:hypothetical protein
MCIGNNQTRAKWAVLEDDVGAISGIGVKGEKKLI